MTPYLEALARRAVACKHWRWMPGMSIIGYINDRILETDKGPRIGKYVSELCTDDLPDLMDPATMGCLLALVRWAWGEGVIVCPQHFAGKWFIDLPNGEVAFAHTEAEALVAALEAAP